MLSSSRDRGDDRALPDPFNRLLHPMLQLTEVALSRSLLGQSLTELHRERLWNQIEGRLWDLLSCYQWSFRDVWLYVPVPTSSLTKPTFNVFWCGLFVTGGRLMKAKDNVHMVNLFSRKQNNWERQVDLWFLFVSFHLCIDRSAILAWRGSSRQAWLSTSVNMTLALEPTDLLWSSVSPSACCFLHRLVLVCMWWTPPTDATTNKTNTLPPTLCT